MSIGEAVYLLRSSIFEILILSMPVLLISLAVGLVVAILQATTSIQEQTLTFVPKIIAIFLSLIFFGPWMFAHLSEFTIKLIQRIPDFIR
jgi:flagellar biosynthetic protein FliQ